MVDKYGKQSTRIKLTYIITSAKFGGAQSNVFELLSKLHQRYELSLIAGDIGYLTDAAVDYGIPVFINRHLNRKLNVIEDMRGYFEIKSVLRQIEPDIVHLHSSKAGILGRISAHQLGIPVIYTAHGWGFTAGVPFLRRYIALMAEKLTVKFVNQIITVSYYDFNLAVKHNICQPSKLKVIHNGIPDLNYEQTIDGNDVQLVMVARFLYPKNHMLLFEALQTIKDLNWKLTLIGDGPLLKDCKLRVEKLGLSSKIQFQGAHSQVAQVLANSHVFVLISFFEGFPISILEAMRAGLPVVASDVGGISESVKDSENGYLVVNNKIKILTERLEKLIKDKSLREKMGRDGRGKYEDLFYSEKMIQETEMIYESVLKDKAI